MIAAYNAVGIRFEHHWIVMSVSLSTATRETTVQMTTEFATMSNHTRDHLHRRTISRQKKEWRRARYMSLCRSVPDPQAFVLKCRDMMENWIEERVAIFHLLWTWNKPHRDNEPFLVAQVRRQIMDNVYKDPAIRVLVMVELSAIERELHENIMILNPSSLDSLQIITTACSVIILFDFPTTCLGIL